MKRFAMLGLLVFSLGVVGWTVADDPIAEPDDPPIRLKRKPKPNEELPAEPQPNRPKAEEPPSDKPAPEEDPQEILARIEKNLKAARQRLAEKDPGTGTRTIQQDIIKDLDALIAFNKRQPPPPSGGGGSSSNQQNQNQSASSSQSQNGGNPAGAPKSNRNPPDGQNPGTGNASANGNDGGQGSDSRAKDADRLADLYKDVWGHLPEAMRMEMDTYAREKFMAKYSDLLRQYYATLAEKGRQRGDR
ncbi:MAG: hypothetical protein ACK4RK_13065 [Gemmataceae bacterium]